MKKQILAFCLAIVLEIGCISGADCRGGGGHCGGGHCGSGHGGGHWGGGHCEHGGFGHCWGHGGPSQSYFFGNQSYYYSGNRYGSNFDGLLFYTAYRLLRRHHHRHHSYFYNYAYAPSYFSLYNPAEAAMFWPPVYMNPYYPYSYQALSAQPMQFNIANNRTLQDPFSKPASLTEQDIDSTTKYSNDSISPGF